MTDAIIPTSHPGSSRPGVAGEAASLIAAGAGKRSGAGSPAPLVRGALAVMMAALVVVHPEPVAGEAPPPYRVVAPKSVPARTLGERLRVTVAVAPGTQLPDVAQLALYLDGRRMPGIRGERVGFPRMDDTVPGGIRQDYEFPLQRTDSTRAIWADLIGQPRSLRTRLRAGVGLAAGPEFPNTAAAAVDIVVANGWLLALAVLLVGGLLGLILYLGIKTSLLRDVSATGREPTVRPYSLAKTVMAWWTLILVGGFAGLWLVTNDAHDIVTTESLVLLGLVAATGATSVAVTRERADKKKGELQALFTERVVASAQATSLVARAAAPGVAADPALVAQADRQSAVANAAAAAADQILQDAPTTGGFLRDLVSDDTGPNIHRLQNLVWNVLLGLVFVVGMYRTLVYPELGSTLLFLLGISNGVYIGLKIPEGDKPPAGNPPSPPPASGPIQQQLQRAAARVHA